MEPVSLAVGLVPLAMNIVQMSSAIRGHISDYKAAPRNIQSIVDKTTLIGRICARLEVDLKSPTPHHEVAILEQALKACHVNVSVVHDELGEVKAHGRRKSLQYLFKKADIERSLFNLNDSIHMLNTCISMSTWMSIGTLAHSDLKVDTEQHMNEPTTSGVSGGVQSPSATLLEQTTRWKQLPVSVSQRCWGHHNGLLTYRVTTKATVDENGVEIQQRSCLVGLPFVGAYVSVAMRYGSLSPISLVLDTPNFIYDRRNDFSHLMMTDGAPRKGSTAEEVVQWARQWKVKPNTQLIDAWGRQQSILGALIAKNKPEAFDYLLCQGGRLLADDQHLTDSVGMRPRCDKDFSTDPVLLYAKMRGPLLTMDEFSIILSCGEHPGFLRATFDACETAFDDRDKPRLLQKAIWHVFFLWFSADPEDIEQSSWGRFIEKLLATGLDIHAPVMNWTRKGLTLLLAFMSIKDFTCDSLDLANQWLGILENISFDTDAYLVEEVEILSEYLNIRPLVPEGWHNLTIRARLEHLLYLVCPERIEPPSEYLYGPNDLYRAIPAYRSNLMLQPLVMPNCELTHLAWKQHRLDNDHQWPFHKDTRCIVDREQVSSHPEPYFRGYDQFLHLMSSRFERRQEKKWTKLKMKENLVEESRRTPGGWEIEWWEYQGGW